MVEMSSLWGYGEHRDIEQLGQKLLFATLELEKFKTQAKEETRKNKEVVNQLIQLLKFAIKERDEAKNQLHNLLNNPISLTQTTKNLTTIPHFQANFTLTDSDGISETYNSVDSLFESVPSPEFSNINVVSNKNLIQESNAPLSYNHVPRINEESLIIDNLTRGKRLPQQGKFLQAVLEAGPLLQTLFVAGPLPRWRIPPPVQIPPVALEVCDPGNLKTVKSQPYTQMTCGSTPMLNFANVVASGSLSSKIDTNSGPFGKRRRFC